MTHSSLSYMFISILYMFRAAMCPSSGELIVSIRNLVYVTLYRWPFGAHVKHNSFSCMFIYILYMFWAAMCPSSGELIVSMRNLVYVTLYRWSFGVQVKPAHQTVIYTEWHIPDFVLIQLILLMMGTWLPKTCREYK